MKTWETPKLIAIVRADPQEAVLSLCKSGPFLITGVEPNNTYDNCRQVATALVPNPCDTCSIVSAS